MMQLRLQQLWEELKGPAVPKEQFSYFLQPIADIVIDSRKVTAGAVFVALKGEHVDGHDFAVAAEQQGAIAIIAERDIAGIDIPVLVVESCRLALASIARFYRQQFNIPVIGITGSCGKTSTKALTASVLSQKGKVLATEGTLNNDLGVPLTLFRLRPEHQYAVIEMGANHPGEIAYLADIAQPTVSLITNAGPVHLEGFGSLDGVRHAKGEIYQALPPKATAIINIDDAGAAYWQSIAQTQQILSFGTSSSAMVYASDVKLNEQLMPTFNLHVRDQKTAVTLPVLGAHQVYNALAAACVGISQGLTLEEIKRGLETAQTVAQRGIMRQGIHGVKILDDSYNANPKAFQAAIDMLMAMPDIKQYVVVMGDMGELGSEAISGHETVGQYAKQAGVNAFYSVGKLTRYAAEAFGPAAFHFDSQSDLITKLKNILDEKTCLLIKGSKSSHMNDVVAALLG